jgi:hypothetical protein
LVTNKTSATQEVTANGSDFDSVPAGGKMYVCATPDYSGTEGNVVFGATGTTSTLTVDFS